ncbi:MAG: hypothetical protein Q8P35_02545 [Candidatus Yanofskybacteria bacterium]|nr:hypothetical protein [Candidatus Yanofskybacteria bacterium]
MSRVKPFAQAVPADQPLTLSALSKTVAIVPPELVTVVYPAVPFIPCGSLQPEGTVRATSPLFIVSVAVNVKIRVFPALPAETEIGETMFVPDPSAALTVGIIKKENAVKKKRPMIKAAFFLSGRFLLM